MLRESARLQGHTVDVTATTDSMKDPLLPLGREIRAFVDAVVLLDGDELPIARQELLNAGGAAALFRVASICAGFESTNRVLDATGVPVNKRFLDIGNELGVTVPEHLIG